MFCNQCEQTAGGTGCAGTGVCGKNAAVADMQDRLVYALRLLARTALKAREKGMTDVEVDDFVLRALFATLTNVNFDPEALEEMTRAAVRRRKALAARLGCTAPRNDAEVAEGFAALALEPVGTDSLSADPDLRSVMQLVLYGLKGVAAYADHAARLGRRDPVLTAFVHDALAAGLPERREAMTLADWLDLALGCGRANLRAMKLLEDGHTANFGHPVPTPAALGHRRGKAILISGHDLADLRALLEQTQGTGINVYTHGEMLPAHGYPALKAFPHLAGHYGTAWQNQRRELPDFPGPALFTTNCIQNPAGYADKVFTTGNVGWPGLTRCPAGDFSAVIRKAREMPGFAEDAPGGEVLTGFGRKTLLDAAPAMLDVVRSGTLRHIFLVGGCDGAKSARSYYAEFVDKTPSDTLVLTLGCGKFRFFDKNLGQIGPFPRLMDVGQCNDAYAAVQVALALAGALDCGVNDLPLSLVLSWYEQKAVAILLTLLALGVRNIRLGPSLPAFVSPGVLTVLAERWNVMPVTDPDADLRAILGQ